jgi:hypothetical protein
MPPVQAKEIVGWTHTVFVIADGQTQHLLKKPNENEDQSKYQVACNAISDAISDKLNSLQRQGKLPFQLKQTNLEMNAQFNSDTPINLVPIIVVDRAFDSAYRIKNTMYYKSVICSGIDLVFCCPDEEFGSWRILGTLPLRYYGVLGKDLLTEPISEDAKIQEFIRITKEGINGIKDFSEEKLILNDLENRTVTPETYQVTDVKISSPKAQSIFGTNQESVKALIAGVFTSSYQQSKQCVIYPSRLDGGWKEDVARNLYSLQMDSPSGSVQMIMTKPKHEIQIDLTGVGKGEIKLKKESDVQQNIGYKVWLKKVPVEGNEQPVITKSAIKQLSKISTAAIMFDDADVFTELLIGAAKDLGNQKM